MKTYRSISACRPMRGLAAALAVSALVACTGDDAPKGERVERARDGKGDIVIGVAWPWAAYSQIRFGEGVQMAVDEINGDGGVLGRRIRILKEDDRGSVDDGRLVAQRLGANSEVVAVIGHLQSYVTVPAAAIYDLSGLVMLAPTATDPELTARGYGRVFRATITDKIVGTQMAEFASRQNYKRVAICYIRNAYGRGLANAFEERASELGVAVTARESYDASGTVSARTFEPVVQEWKSLSLDAVFLAGEVPSATTLIAAMRAQGLDVPILGSDAMNSNELLELGRLAEGTVVPSVFHPDDARPQVRRFVSAFRQGREGAPDTGAALGYDAVHLIADAIRRAGSSVPDQVAVALHATRAWQGVTGPFTFSASGDLVGRQLLKTIVRDGRFEVLDTDLLARGLTR